MSKTYSTQFPFLFTEDNSQTWAVDADKKNDLLSSLVFLDKRKNEHIYVTHPDKSLEIIHQDEIVAKYGNTPPENTRAEKPVVTYRHGVSQKNKDPKIEHYSRDSYLPTLIQRGQFQFLGIDIGGEQIAFKDADRRITEEEEGILMYEQAKAITLWLFKSYGDAGGKARVARHIKAASKPTVPQAQNQKNAQVDSSTKNNGSKIDPKK